MKRTALITGGAGFIGGNFLRLVHEHTDDQLIVVDSLTYAGNLSRITELLKSSRITFIKGDIVDTKLLAELFQKYNISVIVNFAAESHVDRSILNPGTFIKSNIEGVYSLLEAARKSWLSTEGRLFLHISSDEVFGSLPAQASSFTVESRYQPSSPYSACKAAADHLVRAWHATYGLPVIISSCSNNYGPWQFPEKLIPLTILNALEGKEIPIYGDGLQIRDWIHVEDHCRALLKIIQRGKIGETYLVGAQQEYTNGDIVHKICNAVDDFKSIPRGTTQKLPIFVDDRPGHDRRYAIDNSKLSKELSWMPYHRLETNLPLLVEWYARHHAWADEIRSGDYMKYYERQYGANKI